MLIRPPSRILRNVRKPSPRGPSMSAAGTRTPWKISSPVADACSPSFSSSRPTAKPGAVAGTMNALISAAPSSRVPVRAVTTYVPASPAFVMNRFAPSITHVPPSGPSSWRAVVRVPPESLPAPGSVSPYAPRTSPLAIGTR